MLVLISPESTLVPWADRALKWANQFPFQLHWRKKGPCTEDEKKVLNAGLSHFKDRWVWHGNEEDAKQLGFSRYHASKSPYSQSVHNWEEWKSFPSCEYRLCSPVFDSISKQGYTANSGMQQIPDWVKAKPELKIALGGITPSNAKMALSMGYDGLAVLGAVWELKSEYEQLKAIERLVDICYK